MEDLKAQVKSLLDRPEVKRSSLAINNELLTDPKVLAAILGFLVILLAVYRELPIFRMDHG
jgi:hypothetical protein